MPTSSAWLQGQDPSSWPLTTFLAALLLGPLLFPAFSSPVLPSAVFDHYAVLPWHAGLFFLAVILSSSSRRARPSTMATPPTFSEPLPNPTSSTSFASPSTPASDNNDCRPAALPALKLETSCLFNSTSYNNDGASPAAKPSLQERRRRAAAEAPQLSLVPGVVPIASDASVAQTPVSSPSPSVLRRGGAVAGAALVATVMVTSPACVAGHSKVITAAGVPVADYFEPQHEGSLRLWLKPSGTMARNSGRVSRVLSRSHFALDKKASPLPGAYIGHTIVVNGQTRLVSAYTGDVNGDGDVLDAGEGEVFLDEPIGAGSRLEAGRTSYKMFEGFSVATPAEAARVTKEAGQGNDVLQWASAARTVVLAGEVWSTAETADRVLLGPGALALEGSYVGSTMVIGSESRAITHYDGDARVATVSPPFSVQPHVGAAFRILRVNVARVHTVAQLQGPVLSVSPISPTMRFQIHAPVREPAVLHVDFTGHDITVTTGSSVESCVVLAHTPDGFVSVTAMATAASNASTFVVHGARPTLTAGGRAGLQGYGAVALDGASSFFALDSALAPRDRPSPASALPPSNSTTSFAPRNCSASWHECTMAERLLDSSSDAAAGGREAVGDKWSMTLLSVVRPAQDNDLTGVVPALYMASGTLAPPESGTIYEPGAMWVRLGSAAAGVQDVYTGCRVRLMQLDGTKVDRLVVRYSLDRVALLDQPVPLQMVPSKTRFFITSPEPTVSAVTLSSVVPARAAALVGMQISFDGEWRTITHHGARAFSSEADGRVVTLSSPLRAAPTAGTTRFRIVGARILLSLDSAKAHIDVGIGRVKGEEAGEPPLVYQSTVQDGQLQAVEVLSGGSGYVCSGGAFDLAIGASSWHLGSFSCGEPGTISNITMVENAPTVYPGDLALEDALKYPSTCNGKTEDTSGCARKSQHTSISALDIVAGGANYLPGQLRATSGSGKGFAASFTVDGAGALADYTIPSAAAHGAGYGAATEVDVYYSGTDIKMSGSVTTVDVLEGGTGHMEGPLVVTCEGDCVGKGLAGTCLVDAIGAVTQVVLTSHGEGYRREEPPALACGHGGSAPLLIANVASGAKVLATVATGAVLAAQQTRQESSMTASARVSRVLTGKGQTSGCSVGDELLGVGGGGRGLAAQVSEVSSTGEILKLQVQNSGSGYATAPRVVTKSKACRCLPDGAVRALDGTIPGNMDACLSAEISQVVPVAEGWQIQALVVDGERGMMHHYVGGLQARHRMSSVRIGQAADAALDLATLGGRRATPGAGGEERVSHLWKGELAEVLVYQCDASSSSGGSLLGCTTPADLDRLGGYLANKFQLSWEAAAGLTDGIAGATAGPDHALSVVEGKAGAGSVPLLRNVHPRVAIGASSQTITISGRYFGRPGDEDAVQVRVGSQACSELRLLPGSRNMGAGGNTSSSSDESVAVCVVPGATLSVADVSVVAWGVAGTLPGAFHHGAPQIHSLQPATVKSAAGTVLTITGAHLDKGLPFTVQLESHTTRTCSKLEVISQSELRCHLPQLLRRDSRVALVADGQGESPLVSSAALQVVKVPEFYTECPRASECNTCCMRGCQRWELSPDGNNKALGGAYYDHCVNECSQNVCLAGSTAAGGASVQRG